MNFESRVLSGLQGYFLSAIMYFSREYGLSRLSVHIFIKPLNGFWQNYVSNGSQIPRAWSPRATKFCMVATYIFSTITTAVCLIYENVNQLIHLAESAKYQWRSQDTPELSVWHSMYRASYCNVYISRPTRCIDSYNVSLFIIKCSTCFRLFSPSSGATFWSCILQLVYAGTIPLAVATARRIGKYQMRYTAPKRRSW